MQLVDSTIGIYTDRIISSSNSSRTHVPDSEADHADLVFESGCLVKNTNQLEAALPSLGSYRGAAHVHGNKTVAGPAGVRIRRGRHGRCPDALRCPIINIIRYSELILGTVIKNDFVQFYC